MKHRALAVALDFALRGAAGLLLASPVVAAVASTGIARFPEGDRLLFEPGGLMLAEVARSLWSAAVPLIRAELVTGLALGVALIVPYALLLVALSGRASSAAALWSEVVTRVPSLLALHGLTLLAQGGALLALGTVAFQLRGALVGATSRGADLVLVGGALLGGLLALGLGALRDLASAACVHGSLSSRAALADGVTALRRLPGRVLYGWAPPLGAGAALVGAGALLTGALDVSRPGAWRVALVLAVHQAVLLGRCLCRAFWLRRALGLVEPWVRG